MDVDGRRHQARGNGADTRTGSTGTNIQYGGVGGDVFLFTAVADSSATSLDRIRDFDSGVDLLDISGISGGSAAFVGTGGFTSSGDTEVRYVENWAGHAVVMIDAEGNGTEDARFLVMNTAALAVDDFQF